MAYDLTQFNTTNARTYLDLVSAVNTASGGLFGLLIVVVVFAFFLVAFRGAGYDFGIDNFLASSLVTSAIAGLLFLTGLVAWYIVMVPFAVFLILMLIKSMS